MNRFVKNVLIVPLLLLSLLFSSTFLVSCFCGVQGSSVENTYSVNGKHDEDFTNLIGGDPQTNKGMTVFGREVSLLLLKSTAGSEKLRSKIENFANQEPLSKQFLEDYRDAKGAIRKTEHQFSTLEQNLDLWGQTIKVPSGWKVAEVEGNRALIQISTDTLQMVLAEETSYNVFKEKWTIVLELKDISFEVVNDKGIVKISGSNKPLTIQDFDVIEILPFSDES